ncbi:TetR/AcrR family transcriptional regulator [Leptospira gomenensis]|uniref:TetR/AcrR family transcriptional regulator n=1 Tax=Leptospira gomenensis TaxID=2484974 RepID=A0A5F1YCK2_9LEPT|nr:TetR/AcrR family transcriptional regulator [Leptospira gomenensis]TGK34657.1 TetR/AcrR family transcriptional regulator [Leptospira gomenensis]TGK38536.1 TetR/AcrR family transcriptional regulator [Leptospira gomenensis]TGK51046.1 TetR/AcrR family transcriptional regulator [Leptospira gomenensis]TGK68313.1 TetR/AcrR family transcriptional regulator [Leptospira gomenensis]
MSEKIEKNYKSLIESFLRLFMTKDYSEITIGEVSDAAGMTRANFYGYFTGKEELLWKTFRYVFLESRETIEEVDPLTLLSDGKPLTFYLFENVSKNRNFYRKIFQQSIPSEFHCKLQDFLAAESYRTHVFLREKYENGTYPYEFVSHYLSGAALGLISHLIRKELDWNSETLGDWFTSLAAPGIVAGFKNENSSEAEK